MNVTRHANLPAKLYGLALVGHKDEKDQRFVYAFGGKDEKGKLSNEVNLRLLSSALSDLLISAHSCIATS